MSRGIDINDWRDYFENSEHHQRVKTFVKKIKQFEYMSDSNIIKNWTWKTSNGDYKLFEIEDTTTNTTLVVYMVDPHNRFSVTGPTSYYRPCFMTGQDSYEFQNNIFWTYTGASGWDADIAIYADRITPSGTTRISTIRDTINWLEQNYTNTSWSGGTLSGWLGYTPNDNTIILRFPCPTVDINYAIEKQLIDDYGYVPTGMNQISLQGEFGVQGGVRFNGKIISAIRSLDWTDGSAYDFEGSVICGIITPVEESQSDGNSYFYDCYTYSDNFAQTNKTLVNHKWGHIKVPSGCRCWGVVTNELPYNITLHVTRGYEFMGAIQNDGTYISMRSLDVKITARKTVNDGNGVYYFGALSTNIPIFDSEEDGDHYGETGDDSATIYDDVWNGSTTHRFGELITKTQTASYSLPSHGRPYYNVNTHIGELIGWISSERVQSIFADFTLWGNNPIDMVCDFYWTPLDLLTLGYTHSGDHFMKFGYIYAEDLTSSASEPYTKLTCNNAFHSLMGTEYTLVNEVISGVYNDWRDYELFKFKLYLPFMGTIDLPPHLIINKTLKVTIKYFISTHTLHYYVYVDNVVAYEYDVIVGCDVPLTGSDTVGKARQNLSAYGSDYGHLASMGASAIRGDFVGSVASGIGLMTNKIMRDSATSLSTWGTQSVTGNICDYGSCYMVIEEQQHYAPPKLHDMYNYPSYYIGTIGSCSGYCEIENVKLSGMGSFSESEKNKVKELLRNGVIL